MDGTLMILGMLVCVVFVPILLTQDAMARRERYEQWRDSLPEPRRAEGGTSHAPHRDSMD